MLHLLAGVDKFFLYCIIKLPSRCTVIPIILHRKEINTINWKNCWKTSLYTQIGALHCSEMYKDWPFCQNIILSCVSKKKKKKNPNGFKKIWTKTWSSCSHFKTYASWCFQNVCHLLENKEANQSHRNFSYHISGKNRCRPKGRR